MEPLCILWRSRVPTPPCAAVVGAETYKWEAGTLKMYFMGLKQIQFIGFKNQEISHQVWISEFSWKESKDLTVLGP